MMKEKERLSFRKGDGIAIAAVMLIAAGMMAFFLFSAGETADGTVRVYREGALIWEWPLNQDGAFSVSGTYENRIRIEAGRVAIVESSCPGGDCVHTGWISRPGRSVVCLPNRVEVRVEGGTAGEEVDAVVR